MWKAVLCAYGLSAERLILQSGLFLEYDERRLTRLRLSTPSFTHTQNVC